MVTPARCPVSEGRRQGAHPTGRAPSWPEGSLSHGLWAAEPNPSSSRWRLVLPEPHLTPARPVLVAAPTTRRVQSQRTRKAPAGAASFRGALHPQPASLWLSLRELQAMGPEGGSRAPRPTHPTPRPSHGQSGEGRASQGLVCWAVWVCACPTPCPGPALLGCCAPPDGRAVCSLPVGPQTLRLFPGVPCQARVRSSAWAGTQGLPSVCCRTGPAAPGTQVGASGEARRGQGQVREQGLREPGGGTSAGSKSEAPWGDWTGPRSRDVASVSARGPGPACPG